MKAEGIVAALAASVAKPSPDAALIAACEAYRHAWEEADRRHRAGGTGKAADVREKIAERDRWEAVILGTPARTALGRRAKAEAALFFMASFCSGPLHALPRSALLDLLHAADGGAPVGAGRAGQRRTGLRPHHGPGRPARLPAGPRAAIWKARAEAESRARGPEWRRAGVIL